MTFFHLENTDTAYCIVQHNNRTNYAFIILGKWWHLHSTYFKITCKAIPETRIAFVFLNALPLQKEARGCPGAGQLSLTFLALI